MLSIARTPGPPLRPICYRVAVEILDYVMRLAYRAEDDTRSGLLDEARRAFVAYLAAAESQR